MVEDDAGESVVELGEGFRLEIRSAMVLLSRCRLAIDGEGEATGYDGAGEELVLVPGRRSVCSAVSSVLASKGRSVMSAG